MHCRSTSGSEPILGGGSAAMSMPGSQMLRCREPTFVFLRGVGGELLAWLNSHERSMVSFFEVSKIHYTRSMHSRLLTWTMDTMMPLVNMAPCGGGTASFCSWCVFLFETTFLAPKLTPQPNFKMDRIRPRKYLVVPTFGGSEIGEARFLLLKHVFS